MEKFYKAHPEMLNIDLNNMTGPLSTGPSGAVGPAAFAPNCGPVSIVQTVEINQANSNTSPQLANDVGAATGAAATDAMDKLARDFMFAST